jgi:hypothetical protein
MHVPKPVAAGVLLLTFIGSLASPEHLLVLCVGLTFAAGLLLLWPATDSPLLLMPFILQWLQVSLKPIETALTGQPLQDFSEFGEALLPGAWLGIAGIAALGFGMFIGRGRSRFDWGLSLARDAAEVWPQGMVAQIALFLIVAGHFLAVVANYAGPARQVLLAFADARHAGLFLLAYWCLLQGRSLGLLAVVAVVEIAVGFTSYFADFRESVLTLLFAAATARSKLHFRGFLIMGLAALLTFGLAVFWSGIKHNYRDFLNQGTDTQTVDRSMGERLGYVGQAADQFDKNQLQIGLRNLASRESYIDILAATLEHVPTYVPGENGHLLGNSLLNIVQPRIFFPDKPATPDDSLVSAKYTGIRFDMAYNTSISIGYLGELYIDFGKIGAVIGAFFLGLLAGWMYKTMRGYSGIPLLFTYALINALMLQFALFECDLVRLLGAVLTVFAACLVLQRMVAPQVLLALIARVPKVYAT